MALPDYITLKIGQFIFTFQFDNCVIIMEYACYGYANENNVHHESRKDAIVLLNILQRAYIYIYMSSACIYICKMQVIDINIVTYISISKLNFIFKIQYQGRQGYLNYP